MNERDEKKLASIINKVLDERNESIMCSIGIEKDEHEKEHRFIKSLIGISDELGKIGWGFIGSGIKVLGMAIIGFVCLCSLIYVLSLAKVDIIKLLN